MGKVRFIQEKSRTDIDFTLWCVTYYNQPAMVYLDRNAIPEEAKRFMIENSPKESQEGNIKSKVYGNTEGYTYESIVRTDR
ncbi:MAG: hypothetical protein GXY08_12765 [Ruminococcus sp.]|nr:hypothetical protein [Ruminococcus sp.]